ncbi:MAG: hypothetical protein ABI134_26985 [Byssovorax sp.]
MSAHRFSLARAALAAVFLASTGCSVLLKADAEQCETDADCAARGAEFAGTVCLERVCQAKVVVEVDPKWGCLGHVEPPTSGSMVPVAVKALDLVSSAPVKNITAKLCSKYDPLCSSPLDPPGVAADGTISATVPSNFQGYFDVQAPGYIPSLVFLDVVATAFNPEIFMLPPGVTDSLAEGAGVSVDPMAGFVLAATVDCTLKVSAGVSVSIAPSAKETGFYVIASGVSPGATSTDSTGNAGFANVAPGTPTFTTTRGPGGEKIGEVTTLVRAGSVTYLIIPPTPTP